MWRDAEVRMEEVTAPPRLAPLDEPQAPPRAEESIERLRLLHDHPREKKLHGFYATICRSPEVFASYLQLGSDIATETTLPPRERELAILRTGWLCGAPFQWGEHLRAGRQAGLTEAVFDRLKAGSAAAGWSPAEAALLAAVEELHSRATLGDAAWAALAEHFDERQMVELLFLVGHYHMTAFVQNALRIPLNPNNPGLLAG